MRTVNRINQTAVSNFTIRKRTPPVYLIPNYTTSPEREAKIVAPPNNLRFRHTHQFNEVVILWNGPMLHLIEWSFDALRGFGSPVITKFIRTVKIRRVNNRQIERIVRHVPQNIHTIGVVQCDITKLIFHPHCSLKFNRGERRDCSDICGLSMPSNSTRRI